MFQENDSGLLSEGRLREKQELRGRVWGDQTNGKLPKKTATGKRWRGLD